MGVQSTRQRGARQPTSTEPFRPAWFQSTRPQGARPRTELDISVDGSFNPRAREGRDFLQVHLQIHLIKVSIHAPARGATMGFHPFFNQLGVSIHAPARGATCVSAIRQSGFNVSIHAPARGATGGGYQTDLLVVVSIHAPARGATSGSPTGAVGRSGFNPRAREGRDQVQDLAALVFVVSIHAPARGAT